MNSVKNKISNIATDAGIQLYDMTSGAQLQTLTTNKFDRDISISPDGSSFLTTNSEGKQMRPEAVNYKLGINADLVQDY